MKAARGYTMVELIMVMIVLGILSAVMIPRMLSDPGMAGPGFRSDIVAALRYAQKSAVSHRRVVCATVGANTVTLNIAAANPSAGSACAGPALASPDGSAYASTRAITNFTAAAPLILLFQPTGEVINGANNTLANSAITVTAAEQSEAAIKIEGVSGHVE